MIMTTSSTMTALITAISIVDALFPALPCSGVEVIVVLALSEEVILIDAVVIELVGTVVVVVGTAFTVVGYIVILLLDGGLITGGNEVASDVAIEDVVELEDVTVVVTDMGSNGRIY